MRRTFSDAQVADFLRRSYFAVDGLWFVKTEEQHGVDEAMTLDEAVWDVMSKVQARKAKQILGMDHGGLVELAVAFQLKLAAEGHDYRIESADDRIAFEVVTCPWYEILKSSGRTHVAEPIADRICAREFAGWAREFGPGIELAITHRLCVPSDRCDTCRIVFRQTDQVT